MAPKKDLKDPNTTKTYNIFKDLKDIKDLKHVKVVKAPGFKRHTPIYSILMIRIEDLSRLINGSN